MKRVLPYDPAIPLLHICPKEMKARRSVSNVISRFTRKSQSTEQPRSPSVGEWVVSYPHNKQSSAIKRPNYWHTPHVQTLTTCLTNESRDKRRLHLYRTLGREAVLSNYSDRKQVSGHLGSGWGGMDWQGNSWAGVGHVFLSIVW